MTSRSMTPARPSSREADASRSRPKRRRPCSPASRSRACCAGWARRRYGNCDTTLWMAGARSSDADGFHGQCSGRQHGGAMDGALPLKSAPDVARLASGAGHLKARSYPRSPSHRAAAGTAPGDPARTPAPASASRSPSCKRCRFPCFSGSLSSNISLRTESVPIRWINFSISAADRPLCLPTSRPHERRSVADRTYGNAPLDRARLAISPSVSRPISIWASKPWPQLIRRQLA